MAKSSMQQHPVTVYYSKDPLSNLHIRVLLRRQPEEGGEGTRNAKTTKQLILARKTKERQEEAKRVMEERRKGGQEIGTTPADALARAAVAAASGEDDEKEDGGEDGGPASGALDFQPDVTMIQLFGWQQKVCSPSELMLAAQSDKRAAGYSDSALHFLRDRIPRNIESNDVAAARMLIAQAREGVMLSSQRDVDRYIDPDELHKRVTTSRDQRLNPLAEQVVLAPLLKKSQRKHATADEGEQLQPFYILATVDLPRDASQVQLVSRPPSTDLPLLAHASDAVTEVSGSFTKPLCVLKAYEGDEYVRLEMKPPFSPLQKDRTKFDESEWYTFHTPTGDQWRYRIENYSAEEIDMGADIHGDDDAVKSRGAHIAFHSKQVEAEAERLAAHEMFVRLNRGGGQELHDPSLPPPHGFEDWRIFGEIVKCTGFQQEELCVAYELDLRTVSTPTGDSWSIAGPLHGATLESVTQRSKAMLMPSPIAGEAARREVMFGLPMEFKLRAMRGPFLPPILYFHIYAFSRWGVSSPIGYSYLHLPLQPGCHEFELGSWAPLGTLRERRNGFFLGATPPLRDIKLVGLPAAVAGEEGRPFTPSDSTTSSGGGRVPAINNRYGWQSVSGGKLHVRLDMIRVTRTDPPPRLDDFKRALTNLRQQHIARATRRAAGKSPHASDTEEGTDEMANGRATRMASTLSHRSRQRLDA